MKAIDPTTATAEISTAAQAHAEADSGLAPTSSAQTSHSPSAATVEDNQVQSAPVVVNTASTATPASPAAATNKSSPVKHHSHSGKNSKRK